MQDPKGVSGVQIVPRESTPEAPVILVKCGYAASPGRKRTATKVRYTLDEKGRIALSLEYQKGENPLEGLARQEFLRLSLDFKF